MVNVTMRWFILESESDLPPYFLESDQLFGGPDSMKWHRDQTSALRTGLGILPRLHTRVWTSSAMVDLTSSTFMIGMLRRLLGSRRSTPNGRKPKSILTIHNLAFQGWFEPNDAPDFDIHGDGEHVSFLKLGIEHADLLTTVSPRYAVEVQTDEFGCGMEQILCHRGVVGIVNGTT